MHEPQRKNFCWTELLESSAAGNLESRLCKMSMNLFERKLNHVPNDFILDCYENAYLRILVAEILVVGSELVDCLHHLVVRW